jgi:thiamine biosynthesis lipoprotein
MGGRLAIDLTLPAERDAPGDDAVAAGRVARRVDAWARRLTRFEVSSDLSRLNGDPASEVHVRPTLARVLAWARDASAWTDGVVDIALLAERLAVEAGRPPGDAPERDWSLLSAGRTALVRRPTSLGFDLDGIAKGWLADRALRRLGAYSGAIVDADGDVALRVAPGDEVVVGIADPRAPGTMLATLQLRGGSAADSTFGVATSGTTVHRWVSAMDGAVRHHLIDPRTGDAAASDVVQATVLAGSAATAEILAKAAVILGVRQGIPFLEERGARAAILVTADGACLATTATIPWLVAA